MGRVQSLARAGRLDRPALAYLHRFVGLDGWHDYQLTYPQLQLAAAWTARQLAGHGLRGGDRALLTFAGHEGPWARPVADAVRELGVTYATAEAAGWDHARARYLNRELAPRAVIGLSLESVEALSEQGGLAEIFAATEVILARPDAVGPLRAAGLKPATLAFVGPALGLECRQGAGVHVDGARWSLAERDGRPLISGGPQGPELEPVLLPIKGRLLTGSCECGSTDPRVDLGPAS